jgi:hypothetical protein
MFLVNFLEKLSESLPHFYMVYLVKIYYSNIRHNDAIRHDFLKCVFLKKIKMGHH